MLNKRPSSAASHVLYEMATSGERALAHDRMLKGEGEAAVRHMESPSAGIFSQNSAKADLLLGHKLKGDGCSGWGGGRRENSGKAMKTEP